MRDLLQRSVECMGVGDRWYDSCGCIRSGAKEVGWVVEAVRDWRLVGCICLPLLELLCTNA